MLMNNCEFGVFYQVYKNKKAPEAVLKNFRKYFPDNPIVMISDGGEDFSDIAEKYDCSYFWKENIFGNEINGYDRHCYDATRTIEWWNRQKLVCDVCQKDYVMIVEDDVLFQGYFDIDQPFQLRGVKKSNKLTDPILREIAKCGYDGDYYGMCGGSMYNARTLIEIYDNVIEDIRQNHDRLLSEELHFRPLGAVDCSITYHFNKRGHKYEAAPWLGQVCEGNTHLPVVHQWKEHY